MIMDVNFVIKAAYCWKIRICIYIYFFSTATNEGKALSDV